MSIPAPGIPVGDETLDGLQADQIEYVWNLRRHGSTNCTHIRDGAGQASSQQAAAVGYPHKTGTTVCAMGKLGAVWRG
jgi:hypothetical protein